MKVLLINGSLHGKGCTYTVYGILLKMERSWNTIMYCFPTNGRNYIHKFYSIKEGTFL